MAHFAKVLDNKVLKVIVADQDFMDTNFLQYLWWNSLQQGNR